MNTRFSIQLVNQFETSDPEFVKRARPRKYEVPHGYTNPAATAGAFAASLVAMEQTQGTIKVQDVGAHAFAYWLYHKAIEETQMAVHFVSGAILEAAARTKLPTGRRIEELKWPLPVMTFMLPKDETKKLFGRQIEFVTCGVLQPDWRPAKGVDVMGVKDRVIRFQSDAPQFMAYWQAPEDDEVTASYYVHSPVSKHLEDLTSGNVTIEKPKIELYPFDEALEGEVSANLTRTIFSLLLIMAARPAYVEPGQCLRKASSKHGKERPELWSPNYIGKSYAIKRESVSLGGTHASPRMHIRAGHTRSQRSGKGLTEINDIWIEPTLVGGNV